MEKGHILILLVFSFVLIQGCDKIDVTEKTGDERLSEGNYDGAITNHGAPHDYNSLERNIDVLLEAGNLIGSGHYEGLEASVNALERNGKDVSVLRGKLARLRVAPRQREGTDGMHGNPIPVQKDGIINNEKGYDHAEAQASQEPERQSTLNFRRNPEIPTDEERETLPGCENKFFTTTPVNLNDIREITPLGNLGPPGHTFPTDHTFLHVGKYGENRAFPLYAPADVHITMLSWGKGYTQDPIDYTIYFALCKNVIGYYNHVKAISDEVKKLTDEIECEDFGAKAENSCTKILLEEVKEGSLLGEVGYKQGNFDFGLFDLRKELNFVNPKRHPTRTRHIQCPHHYYNHDLQEQFFDLIKRDDAQQCGVTMQDIPGTLKGAWFHETAEEEYVVDWNVFLAFVNDNDFPEVQVVSIAGIFTEPSKFKFVPNDSGLINRKFSQVTADGKTYCYGAANAGKSFEEVPAGKILVQMTSDTQLKIEHKAGSCGSDHSFSKPSIYNR